VRNSIVQVSASTLATSPAALNTDEAEMASLKPASA